MMDITQIMKFLPHRYPFLLVDRVLELVPNERVVAIKNVTMNEPHFPGHFPHHPVMPGVLMIEAWRRPPVCSLSRAPARKSPRTP